MSEKYFDITDDVEVEDFASGKVVVEDNTFYFDRPSVVLSDIDKVASKCISIMCSKEKMGNSIQVVHKRIEDNEETYVSLGYINRKSLKRVFKLQSVDYKKSVIYLDGPEGEVIEGDMVIAYCI